MSASQEVDLSRYRTAELSATIAELISVPQAMRTVVTTLGIAVFGLLIANELLHISSGRNVWWLVSTVYVLGASLVLGFLLGLLLVARYAIGKTDRLLSLTVELSAEIAKDRQAVQLGEKEMPSASQIIEATYEGVVFPIVESTVSGAFGLVGAPILWVYRRTMGGAIRTLIKRMKLSRLSADDAESIESKSAEVFNDIADASGDIDQMLNKARNTTTRVGVILHRLLILPAQVAFSLLAIIACVPVAVFWYLAQ